MSSSVGIGPAPVAFSVLDPLMTLEKLVVGVELNDAARGDTYETGLVRIRQQGDALIHNKSRKTLVHIQPICQIFQVRYKI